MKKESFNDHSSPTFQVFKVCKSVKHMFQGQENVWSPVFFSPCTPPTKKICEACIKFLTMYRKLTKHKMTILSKMNTLGEVPEPIFPGDEIFLNMWIVATLFNVRSSSFWKLYRHILLNQTNSNTMTQRRELESNTEVNLGSLI